jgi:tRNA U34 5-carboxymethylaminomethyl modifying enzyme MnmG/GidA
MEDQLRVKEREYEKANEQAMNAAERFGLLSAEDQQSLLDIRKRFEVGAQGVDVEELKKIRGFSSALDEQIASEARRRSAAAGFGAFQDKDLERVEQLKQQKEALEVNVKAQAEVVAKLDVDVKALANEINKQINEQWGVIFDQFANQIIEVSGKQTKVEQQLANRFNKVGP